MTTTDTPVPANPIGVIGRKSLWHLHPGVRSGDQLTPGERAADAMRNGMGSWTFVFGALAFLAVWMIGNRNVGFDKYPFILLNLVLSCLAAMQGAILLIAAKRADGISSETALHTFTNTEDLKRLIDQNTALTHQVHDLTCKIDEVTRAMRDHIVASEGGAGRAE